LFYIRGFAQAVVPTGPSFRWTTEDMVGNLVPVKILSDEYNRLIKQYEGDSDAALTEWLRMFGTENLLALQGKTKEVLYRPLDEEGSGWVESHSDIEEDYPLVVGFFAPDPIEGNFHYPAYIAGIEKETRQVLRPQDQLRLSNDFLGRLAYEHAKTQVAGRGDDAAEAWLSQVKTILEERYPGFGEEHPIKDPPRTEQLIDQIADAAQDPRLADNSAAKAVNIYMEARAAAQTLVDNNQKRLDGATGFTQSAKTMFLREWLRGVAADLRSQYPDFNAAWSRVFSRELKKDEPEEATAP